MKYRLLFKIENITPDKIPGVDLARYMTQLALMLGAEQHVHFTAIRHQSIGIETDIGYRGRSLVRKRMRDVARGSDSEGRRYWMNINGGLAKLKTKATLQEVAEGKPPVIRVVFPGAEALHAPMPAVRDHVDVRGTLFRIEGRDKTVHAGVDDGERLYKLVLTREQAKAIAPHLFGFVRVQGEAIRTRNADGVWETGDVQTRSIEAMDDEPLLKSIRALRAEGGFGWTGSGGLDALQRLREET